MATRHPMQFKNENDERLWGYAVKNTAQDDLWEIFLTPDIPLTPLNNTVDNTAFKEVHSDKHYTYLGKPLTGRVE